MTTSRILIAEPDSELVSSFDLRLQAAGYQTLTARDGLEATRLAMDEQPDLILLRQSLPAGDGHLVYERLGHIEATSGIPVVLLCGCASGDAGSCGAETAGHCLAAPYETEALLRTVAANLERARQIS